MTKARPRDAAHAGARTLSSLTGARRHTLDSIFRHPSAHNLEWSGVAGLIGEIGQIHEKANGEFVFDVSGKRHFIHKPHSKDLTSDDVIALRHFLSDAGVSPDVQSEAAARRGVAAAGLLIVVDHHGTKIFHIDVSSNEASEHIIQPYDPHHFLHHLTHKDQPRETGQRAPEEPAYYEAIAEAVAAGGKIVVVGHGKGHSNAAHHLIAYLQTHHRETYQRVVREIDADLSAITNARLLDLAREALRPGAIAAPASSV